MDKFFKNYEAFYNMVLSTTILSNSQTEELRADSKRVIDFIGKAYGLDEQFIARCQSVIQDDLSRLGKINDQIAIYANREPDSDFSELDSLFDVKGDVLVFLHDISKNPPPGVNPGWFDYSHYKTYQADIRFTKIYIASASGNLTANRQVGIMHALGIGTQQSYDRAIERLIQCARWGDLASMHYLTYIFALTNKTEEHKLYKELTALAIEYLRAGVTQLPASAEKNYSKSAREYFACISSIVQDVIYLHNLQNINYSFIESVFSPNLDLYARLDYINNYDKLLWKNVTNSSTRSGKKIGL